MFPSPLIIPQWNQSSSSSSSSYHHSEDDHYYNHVVSVIMIITCTTRTQTHTRVLYNPDRSGKLFTRRLRDGGCRSHRSGNRTRLAQLHRFRGFISTFTLVGRAIGRKSPHYTLHTDTSYLNYKWIDEEQEEC